MCRRTGWTWDYVWETLSVDRLQALEKDWGAEPMTHILVAAFMGVEVKPVGSDEFKITPYDELKEILGGLFPEGAIENV